MSQGQFPVLVGSSVAGDAELVKLLKRYFSVRRKSGGDDCQVSQLSSSTFKVCFHDRQAQERVLRQEEHVIPRGSLTYKLTVRGFEGAEGSSGELIQTQEARDNDGKLPGPECRAAANGI
ncbi:protein mono-ADP-ribosyltransferase PARP14 [Carcharodon carcharias]|uniref:protein mono-ADP-ribosyltransferase PARP14 n=1 Tax=Carcharodon carcharias TaxID=13397 RepID=UPI001B7DFD9E|nr:protein mono-ADP-ribosyltransferase PARP14 [Carcharodon carcharias]